jgi:tRNA-2-methylthio-N6-dimethylallyladenosine synthase
MLDFKMNKRVYIHTFGCQMNVHDSEKILGVLEKKGYAQTHNPQHADLIVFNTCSIRQKAEQKFYSELGRIKSIKKIRPELKIAVAGCIAQNEGRKILKRAPYVDYIFGPQNIHFLDDIPGKITNFVAVEDNPYIALKDFPAKREDGVKAWVTIMYGCNNFCSYCIVPYTRGREKSRPSENIYSEVSDLAEKGYKEITLLGQNVNSYNSDTDFPGLLRKINRVDGIDRIRFVTSHPKDLSAELIDAMAELSKVCEHIHLPMQSGSSAILKLMNRGYTYDDYARKVSDIRENIPTIAITSDIIAGFPGETENDHFLTIHALKNIEFDGVFAFNYSPRPHTKAADMREQLSDEIKTVRLNEILGIQDEITIKKNKSLEGTVQEVLIEGDSETDKGKFAGRTRSNKIITITKNTRDNISRGALINVKIINGRKHSLEGNPLG